jgi:hypothetical protein
MVAWLYRSIHGMTWRNAGGRVHAWVVGMQGEQVRTWRGIGYVRGTYVCSRYAGWFGRGGRKWQGAADRYHA